MHTTRYPRSKVLVMAASTRTGSINAALARRITDHLGARATADLVDLRRYPMPRYDGDLEVRDGVPAAANELAERVAQIGDDGDVVGLDHTELDRFAHQAVSERSAP